ncbi:3-oxo-tetronate kinase [Agrococcus sp. Marseille-Q4369]|uniref:3-oxo-tetronate kinase n=1 Tax=Agrococcus sp. Marseille-Q4369 TaxID=2810513 RepID=UPI001B8CE591|nr:3-oxo-tetronate kinase [Agrococcus sp. Marseille-Q4369]QUW17842.1 four-carbon acid sugar kinase family protein [Agrococcus sp. Marseille-Q4369]
MIGVIADDVTGATDVAAALRRAGLRTVLALRSEIDRASVDADAVVIGLKTRSIPAPEAIDQSLVALGTLQRLGASRIYFKYCSTFDSTAEGNIGQVTEALAEALGADIVVTTPAAPVHGRTVYRGYLFVGDVLLHETHMRDHPITPMRDASLLRLLGAQVSDRTAVVPLETIRDGDAAVRTAIDEAAAAGTRHLIVDATSEGDLDVVAAALGGAPLVAGSAGLVGALARRIGADSETPAGPPAGRTALIAGSCSERTLEQIARFRDAGHPAHRIVAAPGDTAASLASDAIAWWDRQSEDASALLYSSSASTERDVRIPNAGALYEETAGIIAAELADRGVERMLIAGGETSGAVVEALGMESAIVGPEAATGAPWIRDSERDLHLVLKSGNFGDPDLFVDVAGAGATR